MKRPRSRSSSLTDMPTAKQIRQLVTRYPNYQTGATVDRSPWDEMRDAPMFAWRRNDGQLLRDWKEIFANLEPFLPFDQPKSGSGGELGIERAVSPRSWDGDEDGEGWCMGFSEREKVVDVVEFMGDTGDEEEEEKTRWQQTANGDATNMERGKKRGRTDERRSRRPSLNGLPNGIAEPTTDCRPRRSRIVVAEKTMPGVLSETRNRTPSPSSCSGMGILTPATGDVCTEPEPWTGGGGENRTWALRDGVEMSWALNGGVKEEGGCWRWRRMSAPPEGLVLML